MVLCTLALTEPASAAPPPLLTKFPANTQKGGAADRINGPTALSVDPKTGGLYVADNANNRIVEFDVWGGFVRAIGWDVAPGAVNELQEVRVRAAAGQFRLSLGPDTTADLPFDATAAEVEDALNGLPSVGTGGDAVTVAGGPGGIAGITPSVYYVTFGGGSLGASDIEEIGTAAGTVPLSGGDPSTLLSARTLANGAAAGVGPEVCTMESQCQAGVGGSAPGQMELPNGLAVDSGGAVYVLERSNVRVQKLDPAGELLLMFGGEVNRTSGANLCTAADLQGGDTCGVGVSGTANGFFEPPANFARDYITLDPSGSVYVGDKDRIQVFAPGGVYQRQIPTPEAGNAGALDYDAAAGNLYFVPYHFSPVSNPKIHRLDPATGAVLGTLTVASVGAGTLAAIASGGDGSVFAAFDPAAAGTPLLEPRIVQFSAAGEVLIGLEEGFASPPVPSGILEETNLTALSANGAGDLYVGENAPGASTNSVAAYGPPPFLYGPPPPLPPQIADQFASSVSTQSATVKAAINPRFWADTSYSVEFGEVDCAVGPCSQQPSSPAPTLPSGLVNTPVPTGGVPISGLAPHTIYHYRFVAQSSGGGPVFGPDRTFRTAKPPAPQASCPNDAYRAGPGSALPDCRAYEMVSPVDKLGADVSVVFTSANFPASLDQSSLTGDRFTFSAYRAFADSESAPYTSQYLAVRGVGGWQNESISPPRSGPSLYSTLGLDSQYRAFDDELCTGWLLQDADISLASGYVAGWPNFYRRDLCAGEDYEALVPGRPPQVPEQNDFYPDLQGFADGGETAIFVASGQLTDDAVVADQLYEVSGGSIRLVCIYPDGSPSAGACSAGNGGGSQLRDRAGRVHNAISDDGSVIYWTDAETSPGDLYARVGGAQTVAVSTGPATFWTAAADGSVALFSEGKALKAFDLAGETSTTLTTGFQGFMGASKDASRVYFVSSEDLASGATAGQPNLYHYEAGTSAQTELIATLSSGDLDGAKFSPVSSTPFQHTSRVTPDGGAAAFTSVASPGLTGHDNTDAVSGRADAAVYVYRADADVLLCVSCNPTGARPTGRNVKSFWAAALIPPADNQNHASRVLAEDGSRLFFESFEPLSAVDTNDRRDVYQWEAVGKGTCATGSPGYEQAVGGCVDLISTGKDPEDSFFVDSSADGRDVFLRTGSTLRPEDPGLVDVYDARVGGGFAFPPSPPPPCQGEACQSSAPAPVAPNPPSASYFGPGDQARVGGKPRRCPKGKHKLKRKVKVRCVTNGRRGR